MGTTVAALVEVRTASAATTDRLPVAAPTPTLVRRLSRSRLAQFCVLGGGIFLASHLRRPPEAIRLRSADIAALADAEAARKGGIPRALEATVAERAIEDELLYREGVKLGFDRDDSIVRQRVIQKTLYLAEELAGASEPPTPDQLRAFYESTRSEWVRPERFRIFQVFTRDAGVAWDLARRARAGESLSGAGEACPLPREATATAGQLESLLGADFVASLRAGLTGTVGDPVHSALGWHVVKVEEHTPAAQATFDEVRGQLPSVYVSRRREAAVASYLERTLRGYDVSIDGQAVTALHPNGRVALRSASSGED